MISLVLCNHRENELNIMEKYSHFLAGRLSEEEWQYHLLDNANDLREFLNQKPMIDIACLDLTIADSVQMAECLRQMNPYAHIILVATVDISPMLYMKPGIMAGSLLLREFSEQQLKAVFEEAFRAYLKKFQSDEDKEDAYVVDCRDGRQVIPYSQIYYFEARDKKITVAGASSEVVCYDTIAGLEEKLPDYFIRCHRSFIVNKKKIVKLIFAQNLIELEEHILIPISRSYKADLKKVF